jgi:hypothetical protein
MMRGDKSFVYDLIWIWIAYGDVIEPGDGGHCPRKSSLFFLTAHFHQDHRCCLFTGMIIGGSLQVVDGPGIASCGDRAEQSAKHLTLRGVWCAMVAP